MGRILPVALLLAVAVLADFNNRFRAPRILTAPVIDGVADSLWDAAKWGSEV